VIRVDSIKQSGFELVINPTLPFPKNVDTFEEEKFDKVKVKFPS